MTIDQLLAQTERELNTKIRMSNDLAGELGDLRALGGNLTADQVARADDLKAKRAALATEIDSLRAKRTMLEREALDEQRITAGQAVSYPVGSAPAAGPVRELTGGTTLRSPEAGWVRLDTREPAAVARGQRTASHPIAQRIADQRAGADQAVIGQHGSLGQMVRALTTTSGSAVVPTVWAADLIDLARAKAAVMQAGATIVPMDAKTVQIGRLTGDPTAAFRAEGSEITASDATFDNVTLTAKSLSALVVGSLEWFQDADNADTIVTNAIAEAMAHQIDLVSLYGGITTGHGTGINLATPPNPRGVLAALNALAASSVLGGATNGTTQTAASYWNEIIDLLFTVRDFNEEPTALIWNSKAARQYAKAYDTTGQPVAVPSAVAEVPRLVTNEIPSFTQGTMANRATDVFAGDWSQLLIGQRLDVTVQILTERYAENGQVGIVAHWRGDVQPARARAFAAYVGLQGAA